MTDLQQDHFLVPLHVELSHVLQEFSRCTGTVTVMRTVVSLTLQYSPKRVYNKNSYIALYPVKTYELAGLYIMNIKKSS